MSKQVSHAKLNKDKPVPSTTTEPTKKPEHHERSKHRNYDHIAPYIFKVLKTVHKDLSITTKGMAVMTSLVMDLF